MKTRFWAVVLFSLFVVSAVLMAGPLSNEINVAISHFEQTREIRQLPKVDEAIRENSYVCGQWSREDTVLCHHDLSRQKTNEDGTVSPMSYQDLSCLHLPQMTMQCQEHHFSDSPETALVMSLTFPVPVKNEGQRVINLGRFEHLGFVEMNGPYFAFSYFGNDDFRSIVKRNEPGWYVYTSRDGSVGPFKNVHCCSRVRGDTTFQYQDLDGKWHEAWLFYHAIDIVKP